MRLARREARPCSSRAAGACWRGLDDGQFRVTDWIIVNSEEMEVVNGVSDGLGCDDDETYDERARWIVMRDK